VQPYRKLTHELARGVGWPELGVHRAQPKGRKGFQTFLDQHRSPRCRRRVEKKGGLQETKGKLGKDDDVQGKRGDEQAGVAKPLFQSGEADGKRGRTLLLGGSKD